MNTLEPPRWPGGPPICPAANLPAFPDEAASLRFHETNSPGSRVYRRWQCRQCGRWHYLALPCSPAGDSSGKAHRGGEELLKEAALEAMAKAGSLLTGNGPAIT